MSKHEAERLADEVRTAMSGHAAAWARKDHQDSAQQEQRAHAALDALVALVSGAEDALSAGKFDDPEANALPLEAPESDYFILEAAGQHGFEMIDDDGDVHVCSSKQLVAFVHSVQGHAAARASELFQKMANAAQRSSKFDIGEDWVDAVCAWMREADDDAALLDRLQLEAKASQTGIGLDYVRYVEDGQVLEKGWRVMRHWFLGDRKPSLREAIRAARDALVAKGGASC